MPVASSTTAVDDHSLESSYTTGSEKQPVALTVDTQISVDGGLAASAVSLQLGRKPEIKKLVFRLTLALLPLLISGCSMFSIPAVKFPSLPGVTSPPLPTTTQLQANYVPVGATASLPSSTFTQEVYQSVRNAKANNSIVLQVLGDDEPIRILPLPSSDAMSNGQAPGTGGDPPAVYVSSLLHQTGVMRKLGRAQAALYRPSPSNFEGVRMDVLFAEHASEQVRPESDYALRPGDRLVIRKDDRARLGSLIDMALGR